MKVIHTLDELQAELRDVSRAGAISDAHRREQFTTFRMEPPVMSGDPDGAAYREAQFALYAGIAGRSYSTTNERTLFDVQAMADRPFPYLNEGWEVTGDQLIATGWLFKVLRLPPKVSILEFGPGWGNTTLALAQNGYQLTAVEIEPNFVALLQERAQRLRVSVDVIQGDFFVAERLDRKFDAVLFFECFHHCADHNRLLDLLQHWIKPDGVVVFAAEPIDENFGQPWGLRLDGQSLWAIRSHGWLELGFTETYFVQALMRRGWRAEKLQSSASPLASCFKAQRSRGTYDIASLYLPPEEDRSWAPAESDPAMRMRFTGGRTRVTLERGGDYRAVDIEARNFAPFAMDVRLSHGREVTVHRLASHTRATLRVGYDPAATVLAIDTETWRPADQPGMGADQRRLGIGVSRVSLN